MSSTPQVFQSVQSASNPSFTILNQNSISGNGILWAYDSGSTSGVGSLPVDMKPISMYRSGNTLLLQPRPASTTSSSRSPVPVQLLQETQGATITEIQEIQVAGQLNDDAYTVAHDPVSISMPPKRSYTAQVHSIPRPDSPEAESSNQSSQFEEIHLSPIHDVIKKEIKHDTHGVASITAIDGRSDDGFHTPDQDVPPGWETTSLSPPPPPQLPMVLRATATTSAMPSHAPSASTAVTVHPAGPSHGQATAQSQDGRGPGVKQEYYEFNQSSLIETLYNDDWYGGKTLNLTL